MGLASGLGAAVADTLYGLVAALGLTWVADLLLEARVWLGLVGGAVILALGVKVFLTSPPDPAQPVRLAERGASRLRGRGLPSAWASTFLVTLTSPITLVAFATAFAGLGLVRPAQENGFSLGSACLVAGVFAGSSLWWSILAGLAGFFRHRLTRERLLWINRLAGAGLVVMAVLVAWQGVFGDAL